MQWLDIDLDEEILQYAMDLLKRCIPLFMTKNAYQSVWDCSALLSMIIQQSHLEQDVLSWIYSIVWDCFLNSTRLSVSNITPVLTTMEFILSESMLDLDPLLEIYLSWMTLDGFALQNASDGPRIERSFSYITQQALHRQSYIASLITWNKHVPDHIHAMVKQFNSTGIYFICCVNSIAWIIRSYSCLVGIHRNHVCLVT